MTLQKQLNRKAELLLEEWLENQPIERVIDLHQNSDITDDELDNLNFELAVYFDKELGGEDSFMSDVPEPTKQQWHDWETSVYDLCDIVLKEVFKSETIQGHIADLLSDESDRRAYKEDKFKFYGMRKPL